MDLTSVKGKQKSFAFNQANTSQRDKRHNDGLELPRKSLELPMKASRRYHDTTQSIPVKHQSSKPIINDRKIPAEKLIDKGTSGTRNVKPTPPSLGHLMKMDTFPFEKKSGVHEKVWKYEKSRKHLPRKEPHENSVPHSRSLSPRSLRQTKNELEVVDNKQNFTMEFEAWQASKLRDRSANHVQKDSLRGGEKNPVLTQEYHTNEKKARYIDSRNSVHKKSNEIKSFVSKTKLKPNKQQMRLGHEEHMGKQSESSLRKDVANSRNGRQVNKFDHSPATSSYPVKRDILETSTERVYIEESQVDSNKIDKRVPTEDFREEVKERLRMEIERRGQKSSTTKNRINTSFGERSNDAKQLARDIATHIKKSVSRDLGAMLTRSKSIRFNSNKAQINEPHSPEFIRRNSRKLVSDKLENVVRIETEAAKTPNSYARPGSSLFARDKLRLNSKSGQNAHYSEDHRSSSESIPMPYKRERSNNMALDFDAETVSPQGLIRSFSAPASATVFGKLLFEDDHTQTAGQICMELEASEHASAAEGKNRKTSFNLKGRVSNLRQNLTLRGMLFSRRIQSARGSTANKSDPMNATSTTYADVLDLHTAQDNSSEVPPSPTSVSSNSLDEFSKQGHPSPVSILDVPFCEDHPSPQISEISFSELVENAENEQIPNEGQTSEHEIIEVEGDMQAYLRDILVSSGLNEGTSSEQEISRWEALTKPIPQWVFDIVEEAHSKYLKLDNRNSLMHHQDNTIDQRILFDMVNEELPYLAGTPLTSSMLKSWVVGQRKMPHGRRLLSELWNQIQTNTHSRIDDPNSVDRTVDRDIKMSPWTSLLLEDVDVVEKEMERLILGELIDEFTYDLVGEWYVR